MSVTTRMASFIPACLIPLLGGCIGQVTGFHSSDRSDESVRSELARSGAERNSATAKDDIRDPFYVERGSAGEPHHHYLRERVLKIEPPTRYGEAQLSKVAVWWSNNDGFHWQEAGNFDAGRGDFRFEVAGEGDYAIRFVGPGDPPAQRVLATPERVYHVDSLPPEVEVVVTPEKSEYRAGEQITISWSSQDANLRGDPVRIGMVPGFATESGAFVEVQRGLAEKGSLAFELPKDSANQDLLFRAEALDEAGNLGLAYSFAIQVLPANEPPADFARAESEMDMVVQDDRSEALASTADAMHEIKRDRGISTDAEIKAPARPMHVPEEMKRWVEWLRSLAPYVEKSLAQLTTAAATSSKPPATTDEKSSAEQNAQDERHSRLTIVPTVRGWLFESARAMTDARDALRDKALAFLDQPPTQVEAAVAENDADEFPIIDRTRGALLDGGPSFASNVRTSPSAHDDRPVFDPPRPVPFATAVARLADTDAQLIWRGGSPTAYPTGNTDDSRRNPANEGGDGLLQNKQAVRATRPFSIGFDLQLRGAVSQIDVTHGNGILVPMPATVESAETRARFVTAHPWRILGNIWSSPIATVWTLPNSRKLNARQPEIEGRFLADHPGLRTVTEPATKARFFGGGEEITATDVP